MPTSNAVLLPSNVQPASYAIHLTPDLVAFTFTGEESVTIEVLESTNTIVMNASELQVSEATFTPANGPATAASDIAMDTDKETLTLTFPSALSAGEGTLHIVFTGEMNDRLTGFYRSQYTDSAGQSHTMATTQFEPSSARRHVPTDVDHPLKHGRSLQHAPGRRISGWCGEDHEVRRVAHHVHLSTRVHRGRTQHHRAKGR